MIKQKYWCDTVGFIAVKLMGPYFSKFPKQIPVYVNKWLATENIWLQRAALLFQLKYKEGLDMELLSDTINCFLGSKDLFVNKAIGWALREYSRTNPTWVVEFE